jgi:hypothetical protein
MADIYGQLIKAQLENLGSDISSPPTGVAYFNTGSGVVKFYDGSAWRTAVTTDNTQTLTNKTLTSPTVATPNFDDYVDFNEEAAPSTPAAGKVRVYAKSDGHLYAKDDAGTESDLTAGGGAPDPDSQAHAYNGNGNGSSTDKIRRFSNNAVVGTDITYADSASNGASFTINADGIYALSYSDVGSSASGARICISLNQSNLLTQPQSLSATEILAIAQAGGANKQVCCSVTVRLSSGDVIRPSNNGDADTTGSNCQFWVTQLYKL